MSENLGLIEAVLQGLEDSGEGKEVSINLFKISDKCTFEIRS